MSNEPAADSPEELLSVELVGDELHMQLGRVDLFEDPAVWGEALANVAQQIAERLGQLDGSDPAATLRAIADSFAREIATPPGADE